MKAIITELKNGYKTYMVFESVTDKIYEVFSKLVKNTGFHYIHDEETFDELKEDWFPFEIVLFKGRGIYSNQGEFLGTTLIDSEDGTKYHIDEQYSQKETEIVLIDNMKVITKQTIFS